MTSKHYFKLFLIWSIVSLVYGLEFFIRISPNMLQSFLKNEFNINYTQLGKLSAAFYYSYALCQIPATLFMIRYGVKKSFLIFSAFFIIGLVFFAHSHSLSEAFLARILMGFGASISFILLLELAHRWFDEQQFSFYVGLANTIGMLGALLAEYPLELALNFYHWRTIMLTCAYALCLLVVLFVYFYSDHHKTGVEIYSQFDHNFSFNHLPFLFQLILIGCSMVLPLIVLPALWGTLILEHYHHVDFANSAWILSFFFFGTITGSLSKAALSLHITGVRLLRIAIATEFFSLFLFVFNPTRSHGMLALSCFFIGLAASFMLLIFTFIQKKISQPALSIVIVNVTVLLISVCFQPLMGWYLDYTSSLNWSLEISLKTALLVLPLVLIPAYTVTHHLTD